VIIFPNAKINLGLNIVSKREDGYHNIETVFYPVKGLCDIIEYRESRTGETSLDMGGIKIDSTQDDNLVFKAYKLLAEEHKIPALDIMLRKNIPSGAGLGGGSADAAFMLTALNEEYGLGINEDAICKKAAVLVSD
jgi:4-diphosphocytidyl-2-C-methyl-D-erythritol kinase